MADTQEVLRKCVVQDDTGTTVPGPLQQALESHCSGFTRQATSCVKGSAFSSVKMGRVRMPTHCVILHEIIKDLFIIMPGT